MPKDILRLYTPHSIQREFHESKSRYRVLATGRQCGKSSACLNELLKHAWEKPNTKYWMLEPTFDQCKDQFRKLIGMLWNCSDVIGKHNLSELRVRLINGSEISFKSGETLENLRGSTLNGVVIDEVREQSIDLWSMVLRPMLSTTNGWAVFVSTPNGFDHFYDIANTAMADKSGLWWYKNAPSIANPSFPKEEFERLKNEMTEAQFAQEILAEFRDLTSGKAYVSYSEKNISLSNIFASHGIPHNPYLPIYVGCDFNLSPMAWVLAQSNRQHFHFFDEVWLKNSHTQEASSILIEKLKRYKEMGMLRANPQVIIAGDATSHSGQRAAAGQSDYDILFTALNQAGFSWQTIVPSSNPSVKDRVNTVNSKLMNANGMVSVTIDPTGCPNLKRDFERVVWKPGTSMILDQMKDTTLTHASDGAGYLICALSPLPSANPVGTLRVIVR